jgi:hypothetical protein
VRIPIAGVEDAGRLARTQSAVGKGAPAGHITLTDGPPTPSMNDLTHVHQATASSRGGRSLLETSGKFGKRAIFTDSTDVELRFVDVGQTNNWNKKAMFVLRTRRGETCTAAATKKKYFTPLDSNERNFDPENWVCLMRMRPDNGSGHGEEIEQ